MSVLEAEALELHESISGTAGPIRPDGLVPLHIIRPGIGKGRGRHLYEADMLENEVRRGRFGGWKMYVDHLDPAAKKKSAGMPRSIRDLAGVIKETWWDGSVPADPKAGHGQGAVIGLAKVTRFMRSLIEDLPEAVGASISATASGVRPVQRGGQQVWLVEGINPRGSVDWVTEAGAGGKVVSLMEALEESFSEDDMEVFTLLESKTDGEIVELLREEGLLERPGIRAALMEAYDGDDVEPDDDEDEAAKGKKKKKGRKEMHESRGDEVDTELLQEALESDEGRELLESAAKPVVEKLFREMVAPRLGELIEAAIEDERELIQAEANASADRRLQIRDMRDAAHAQIDEARLPEPFKHELRARYDLVEGEPTPALDVVDDDPKEVSEPKTASEKLAEAVAADLETKTEQFRASRPATRVSGQGERRPAKVEENDDKEGDKDGEAAKTTGSPLTDHALAEAGIQPTDDLWADLS